jgi:uncharacterized protein YciI
MPYFVVTCERSSGWNWLLPMRRQAHWEVHATFLDALASEGFIVAGGPLGSEDDAKRVMHIVSAPDRETVEGRLAHDPWAPMRLLTIAAIEPWTILLGGLHAAHEHDG